MLIGIVAISENFAIGKNGKLPWHYPADLKFFKETTIGNAVVMGMTTWRSIGKPLPNRLNIVLTRNSRDELPPGVIGMADIAEIESLAKYLNCDIYVIGGASIYNSLDPEIDKWVVTHIPEIIEDADVFMPEDFLDDFNEIDSQTIDGGLIVKTMLRR